MQAKATANIVAAECHFFKVSASEITASKYGDSEKLVKMLFTVARHNAPSIIFIGR